MPQTELVIAVIAVIDDSAPVRRALQRLLRADGFAVETFAPAREFFDADYMCM